jgi:hypothetical protein
MGGDDYLKIECVIVDIRAGAVLLRSTGTKVREWCPRSLLHAATDAKLADNLFQPMTIQIREWKARALKLA